MVDDGALYSWGQGYNGRLGHGNQETKPTPTLVTALDAHTIVAAVAGVSCWLLIKLLMSLPITFLMRF